MAILHAQLARVRHARENVGLVDAIALLAAILSLLTLTILVPGGFHLP